jgi:murein DD-endopeptidase MepM/ murein hydrolase activator NlpD
MASDLAVFPVWRKDWIQGYGTPDRPIVVSCVQGHRKLQIGDKLKVSYHRGLDFALPIGTVLLAPEYCLVAEVNTNPKKSGGVYIRLLFPAQWPDINAIASSDIGFGFSIAKKALRNALAEKSIRNGAYVEVWLMHLDSVYSNTKKGEWIKAGTAIATTGNTGDTTGPHLHIQIGLPGSGEWLMPAQFMSRCSFKLSEQDKKYQFAYDDQVAPYSWPQSEKLGYRPEQGNDNFVTNDEWRRNWLWRAELRAGSDEKLPYSNNATEPVEIEKVSAPENARATSDLLPGIWQIVKLIIDDNAAFRQVFDTTITNSTGSLLNWFNKVCQKPFVEFMGDTWGDQYYFTARRPPFDAAAVKEAYADALYSNNGYLSIHPNKVLSTSLTWSVNTAYSWYRLAASVGFNNNDDIGGIPAVFFPEMAALFGSRVCNIQSNYVNLIADGSSAIHNQDKEVADTTKENVIRSHYRCLLDLKYLIESTIYVPFTRQGTITLYGDRRIKRGSWVYFVPTGELYYVEQVSNTFKSVGDSIQRTTSLQVSHGMFVRNIESAWRNGEYDKNLPYSYFDIVDFGDQDSWKNIGVKNSEGYPNELFRFVADFKIRKEVLDYFWSKKQVLETRTNLYMTEEELNEG